VKSVKFGAFTTVTVLATAAIVASVLFSASLSGEAVSARAVEYAQVETALSSVVGARAATQQALLFGAGGQSGAAVESSNTALKAIDVMSGRLAALPEASRPGTVGDLEEALREVVALVASGSIDAAAVVVDTSVGTLSEAVVDDLSRSRDAALADLASTGDSAARVATVTRFVVALAVPVLAVLGLWLLYRRREDERRLAERLETETNLRRSQDAFIANVSHELRTPLTTILGFTQLLDTNVVADPAERADLVRLVYGEAGELARMVDDLLIAARVKTGELAYRSEPVEVASEVAEVAAAFLRTGRRIDIDVQPGRALVDRLRLRQIIRNLVANATRYGGENLAITGEVVGDRFRLTVADDGAGLDAEAAAAMFERFVGVEDSSLERGGLGLGLSIVQILTVGMDGTVVYEREDNQTRFIVDFPVASRVRSAHV